jgi:hypothetical protein
MEPKLSKFIHCPTFVDSSIPMQRGDIFSFPQRSGFPHASTSLGLRLTRKRADMGMFLAN